MFWFKKKDVASVLGKFANVVNDLEQVASEHLSLAAIKADERAIAAQAEAIARFEADKATKLATKFKEFFN